MVGLIKNTNFRNEKNLIKENDKIYLIGKKTNNVSCSSFLERIILKNNKNLGPPPPINFNEEIKNGNFVLNLFKNNLIKCCNDVSSGGTIISLLKMLINKEFGVEIEESFINNSTNNQNFYKILFGENAANYIIITNNEEKVKELAKKNKVSLFKIGITKRNYLNISNQTIKLNELKNNFENNFFNFVNN